MNKLGFAIKLASQGASNAIECNKDRWTNKVVDIREYLKLFNGLQGTDNIVTFMSFDEGGCFLTQLRAISGRVGDFLSGWVYIPNNIEANGEDIMNAYNYVQNILSRSNLNDCTSDIESFFSKEYPEREYITPYVPSSGEDFGYRYYDAFYSMKEILGTNRYQPYYSKYKAIFLLDEKSEVKISEKSSSKFKDLTKEDISQTCIFKAPSEKNVNSLGQGAKVIFQDNQEFKSDIVVKKDDKIQLYVIRDGFEPVALPPVIIKEDVQILSINPQQVEWYKKIKPIMFAVYDCKRQKIEKDVQILINGKDVTKHEISILEKECRNASIKVSAPDYKTNEQKRNLLNDYCEIVLDREEKTFQATIELANGHLAQMTIKSEQLPSSQKSPLKGYDYEQDEKERNILKVSFWFVWKQRLWGFLAALAAVTFIIVYITFEGWLDTHHFKFGLLPGEADNPVLQENLDNPKVAEGTQDQGEDQKGSTDTDLNVAIHYLDGNNVWKKSQMEEYSCLKGLFDDMNNFELDSLTGKWYSKLSGSRNFTNVCNSAKKTAENSWNPKQGTHNPTYNTPNDEWINLDNYTNWLNHDQTHHTTGSGTQANKPEPGEGTNGNL